MCVANAYALQEEFTISGHEIKHSEIAASELDGALPRVDRDGVYAVQRCDALQQSV